MSKKNFKGGLDSLLGGEATRNTPDQETLEQVQTETGRKARDIRATFIVDEDLHEKVKAIAYFERENIKDTLDKALREYTGAYESKNGTDYLDLYKRSSK